MRAKGRPVPCALRTWTMKFTQLAKSLKEGLAPVYVIEGEEAYFRDSAVAAIRSACALQNPMLNDARYEGENLKGEGLAALVRDLWTLPFLDGRRLVRACELYPTEREWEGVLKAYCAAPCPSTVFLIVNGGKKAGAAQLSRKAGVVYVDCSREDEETLSRWLFGVARRAGLVMDADAAQLMVRYCARDAARMKAEVQKFACLLGEGGHVTRAFVEENVAKDVEYKIYELTQAASRKNFALFSEILTDMLAKGSDEYAVLAALISHFRTLCEVGLSDAGDAELAKALGSKPYAVQKNRETAARLGRARVRELYEKLYALSSGAKRGVYGKRGALDAAIAEIFFG